MCGDDGCVILLAGFQPRLLLGMPLLQNSPYSLVPQQTLFSP